MKSTLLTHCRYFLITIAMFGLGVHLAPHAPSSHLQNRSDGAYGVGEDLLGSDGLSAMTAFASGFSTAPDSGEIASDLSLGTPLINARLDELSLTSLRSRNPLERRRAFDHILNDIGTATITPEQSMAIRHMMFENGAGATQWRLLEYAWGASSPGDAIALISEVSEEFRDDYIGNILPGLASSDPQAAIDFFKTLDVELQAKLRSRLYEGLIDSSVEIATAHIFDQADDENHDWRPMDVMTREIVRDKGLEPTLEWASTLPQGALRNNAWSAAYAHWGTTEPHAAIQSILELPDSSDRNQAINGFISAHAHQDGEIAAIWASEITHPILREEAMVRAARQYYRQDQNAAAAWFSSTDLPRTRWEQIAVSN